MISFKHKKNNSQTDDLANVSFKAVPLAYPCSVEEAAEHHSEEEGPVTHFCLVGNSSTVEQLTSSSLVLLAEEPAGSLT